MKENIKIVVDETLSTEPYKPRYVVIDSETGEVLDNAQGYGYKSHENARKAYFYGKMKNKTPKKDFKKMIFNWKNKNKEASSHIDDAIFYAWKDGEELTVNDIKSILSEHNIQEKDVPFNVKYLLTY